MLKQRILSALIGIPLMIGIIYAGGIVYFSLIALVAVLCQREYLEMINSQYHTLPKCLAYIAALLLIYTRFYQPVYFLGTLFLIILIYNIFLIAFYPKLNFWELAASLWGIIYIGGSLSYLPVIRGLEKGYILSLLLFLIIWLNDSGAYFSGLLLGKRKLAPGISPKKTVEGAIGGLLTAVLLMTVSGFYLKFSLYGSFLLGLAVALAGQLGDLVVSALKRQYGIKDSGKLIPGHGGFLDRFDSLIFAAPVYYMLSLLLL